MRKLPEIGPLLVPTLVQVAFANVGTWLSTLVRLAGIVLLILVVAWVFTPKRAADVNPRGPSSSSSYPSLESSPYAVQAGPARPEGPRTMDQTSAQTGRAAQTSADAAPGGSGND
jgi:hypothetical protein